MTERLLDTELSAEQHGDLIQVQTTAKELLMLTSWTRPENGD